MDHSELYAPDLEVMTNAWNISAWLILHQRHQPVCAGQTGKLKRSRDGNGDQCSSCLWAGAITAKRAQQKQRRQSEKYLICCSKPDIFKMWEGASGCTVSIAA